MGEEMVSSYLRSKFSSILQEAEADPSSPSRIISRFRSIERRISFMYENLGTTTGGSASGDSSIRVDVLYDLIDALSECRIFAHHRHKAVRRRFSFFWVGRRFFFFWVFCFKKKMKTRLDEIEEKLKISPHQDITRSSPSGLEIQQTYPILNPSLIIGFESQAEIIEAWLMADNLAAATASIQEEEEEAEGFTAIGIVGRCGCGKTALAQKVFASPRVQEEFSPRIWVCLSNMLFDNERVDPRVRVLNYILEEIGHDISELEYADPSVVKLLEKLQRGLMGKRYLIVLDDAWRVDEWYANLGYSLPRDYETGEFFSHGLPKGSGGAIIVTSRRESVIRRTVGGKHVIRLEPHLSDDICWKIFSDVLRQQTAGETNLLIHPKLIRMEDDVKKKCDGLPLAAKTLANIIPNLLLQDVC